MSLAKVLVMEKKIIQGLTSRWRNFYYSFLGVNLDGYVWLRAIEIPRNYADIKIESNCALDRGVTLLCSGQLSSQPKISIGADTYINRHSFIDAIASVKIGKDCAIGPNCYITDHDHGLRLEFAPLQQPMVAKSTKIGDRVWLGANVTVLKGVTIGDDVVIGAGSVVNKDIPACTIAVGAPAQVIKSRLSQSQHLTSVISNP